MLAAHGAIAEALWKKQERLRAESLPSSKLRAREPTPERLLRIADRLASGATPDECAHVLDVYAAEARRSGSVEWFNGETNWRSGNFERALGRTTTAKQRDVTIGIADVPPADQYPPPSDLDAMGLPPPDYSWKDAFKK